MNNHIRQPELEHMRISGRILAEALEHLTASFIKPGVSSLDISREADRFVRQFSGAIPAFLGYRGFPEAACVSVNTQVVHTIPRDYVIISEGDLVSVDFGVIYKDHYSDACRTVIVGKPKSARDADLVATAKQALDLGIAAAVMGNRIGDISFAIQTIVERRGFSVNLNYCGHGIGRVLHTDPLVRNYGKPGTGDRLKAGMCLAIEPVIFDGDTNTVLDKDGWTVYSKHNNLSAHTEDTIIVTDNGPEIITRM
jgi:methionyl aminopeptidase